MPYHRIGIAKEIESPENPGGMEKRVSLVPEDVKSLITAGISVAVEEGAGLGVGFTDEDYRSVGATIEPHARLYTEKDLIIKFKGPALETIDWMRPDSTLFCMAHFHSYPERAEKLAHNRINVIAMEEILESPKFISDKIILSKKAMQHAINTLPIPAAEAYIYFLGYGDSIVGGIRRAGNRNPHLLKLLPSGIHLDEISNTGPACVFFYDKRISSPHPDVLAHLNNTNSNIFELSEFEKQHGAETIKKYRNTHPPFEFGLRRIECLHETGRAGARYGFTLLAEKSVLKKNPRDAKVVILGYGNVGMGAIHEAHHQGCRRIHILGRCHTQKINIGQFIKDADLIINGAEQPLELRGKNFLLSREHVRSILKKGTVVIDLVGGSPTNRSPVENVETCTFLTKPYFMEDNVYFAALWGWPMMGFMRETAIKYSSQIKSVLIEKEKLIRGLGELAPGIKRALVCGPYGTQ
ncbi:hypothetical protein QUF70_09155 [Desulfobacterales bacterium HSG17]|nr:hypothetical protein [Desulfobacterales bacterium HSG17]